MGPTNHRRHQGTPEGCPPTPDLTDNNVRAVYEAGVWKLYGLAAAVGRCAGEMQMAMEGRATAGPNAATTERKKRRANAKAEMEKAKKLAEGMKEGAAYAAPPTSPDSRISRL